MSSHPELGLGLTFSRDQGARTCGDSKYDHSMALQEEEIEVQFILPDDSDAKQKFKKGQIVAVLKSFLQEECDLKMEDVQLYYDDRLMLDPLSLTDFKGVEKATRMEVSVRHNFNGSTSTNNTSRK